MEEVTKTKKEEALEVLLGEEQEDGGQYGDALPPESLQVGWMQSVEVVPANNFRKWLILTNVSDNNVFLSFGHEAEATKGVFLRAGGGQLILGGGFNSKESINAISVKGNAVLTWQEAE